MSDNKPFEKLANTSTSIRTLLAENAPNYRTVLDKRYSNTSGSSTIKENLFNDKILESCMNTSAWTLEPLPFVFLVGLRGGQLFTFPEQDFRRRIGSNRSAEDTIRRPLTIGKLHVIVHYHVRKHGLHLVGCEESSWAGKQVSDKYQT